MSNITAELAIEKLNNQFGDQIISSEMLYDFLTVTVAKKSVKDVLKFLHDDAELSCRFLTTCCGLHYPDLSEQFGMMYQLHNMVANFRIRVKSFTAEAEPVFETLTDIWPTANWMEREAYDFFGFKFLGHPKMKRIYNMDSLEGWPLRKEFPLEDPFRADKDDKMFGR